MRSDAVIDRLLYDYQGYTHDILRRVMVLVITFPKCGTFTLYESFVEHSKGYNYTVIRAHSLIELIGGDDPVEQWIDGECITFGSVIRRIIELSMYDTILIIGSYRSPVRRVMSFANWYADKPPYLEIPAPPITMEWYSGHRDLINPFRVIQDLWRDDMGIDISRDDEFCPHTNVAMKDISEHLSPSKKVLWMGTTIDHGMENFFTTISREFVFFKNIRMIRSNDNANPDYRSIINKKIESWFDTEVIDTMTAEERDMMRYFHLLPLPPPPRLDGR